MNRRLFRSEDDRVVAGVAGGMAQTYDLDPALVRAGWVLLILFSGGLFLIVYAVMALVVPPRPLGLTLWASAGPGNASPPSGMDNEGMAGPTQAPASGYGPSHNSAGPFGRPASDRNGLAGAVVIGTILVIVGSFFLLRQFLPSLNVGAVWPLLAIGGGVVLIVAAFLGRRPDA
jgi:phage shock protein C